jgi:DHA1 family tetracycline resistance protein-like MFS transporter
LLSIAGSAAGFVLLGFANTLALLFLSRIIDGLTGGNVSVAQAYIADVTTPEERGKSLGMIGAAFGIGFIIGPVVGGLLISPMVHQWLTGVGINVSIFVPPALAATLMCLVNLVLVFFVLPESLSKAMREDVAHKAQGGFSFGEIASTLRRPVTGPLLVVMTVTGLTFAMFESGFTIWAPKVLGVTATGNALILAYVGVLLVLVQLFAIGPLTKRFADSLLIFWGVLATGLTLAAWGLVQSLVPLLLLFLPLCLAMATSNTVLRSSLSKSVGIEEVGGILGLAAGIQAVTRALGAPFVGALLQYVGNWAPGVIAGVLTVAVVPYIAWAMRRPEVPITITECGNELAAEGVCAIDEEGRPVVAEPATVPASAASDTDEVGRR